MLISYLLPEKHESGGLIEGLNLSNFECSMAPVTEIRDFRYGFLAIICLFSELSFYFWWGLCYLTAGMPFLGLQDICCNLECGREDTQQWHEPGEFLANGELCRYICLWVWLTHDCVLSVSGLCRLFFIKYRTITQAPS